MTTPLPVHAYETKRGYVVAVQVTADNIAQVADWTGGKLHRHSRRRDDSVEVPAITGFTDMVGDWIVRYPDGRFQRLHDREFHDRYQRAAT